MATIALEGMHFFAHHGYYEEEQILGNDFILDVYVNVDTSMVTLADDLYFAKEEGREIPITVNYETVYLICQAEMRKPTKMLEAIVGRLAERIAEYFDNVRGVMVRLKKLNPPLGGRVDSAWVMTSMGKIDTSCLS